MYIAIDDTDSPEGMCTTYLTCLILRKFKEMNLKVDSLMPNLIRLNPNIPYKTRGNGACYFRVNEEGKAEEIIKIVLNFVSKYSRFECENTNPGVVFLNDDDFERKFEILNKFYKKAVSELVHMQEAEEIAKKVNAKIYKFKLGRGIIGALASLGCDFSDLTYELLVYRKEENFYKERMIDEESVFKMNSLLYPETFDNVNEEEHKVVFMPHGKDPVLCGIRGNSVEVLQKAFSMIKFLEEISFYSLFKTNQHTDAHLKFKKISELKQYDAAIIEGTVVEEPKRIKKGHTFFKIKDDAIITVAAYGVTKLKDVAINLVKNDRVRIYGGIGKYKNTINAEKIEILELNKIFKKENPVCPKCNIKVKSEGKNKGFQCRKCKLKLPKSAEKFIEVKRNLNLGIYEVQPGQRRHLSKPLCRYQNL